MVRIIQDRNDNGKMQWKVLDKNGKIIIVTTSEDVAKTYYRLRK
tara:strand:- start:27 stop:158 length:132 start_codon:yes stop_codon:yes gene_type:complete